MTALKGAESEIGLLRRRRRNLGRLLNRRDALRRRRRFRGWARHGLGQRGSLQVTLAKCGG
jgi:hypothetical protein